MNKHILKTVRELHRKYRSQDPYVVADALGIHVWERDLNNLKGCYNIICRERYIFINEKLPPQEKRIICAHELGHDRLHQHFAKYSSLQDIMLYDMRLKPEREANMFASAFLISDEDICEYQQFTTSQMAKILGVGEDYVKLKLELMRQPHAC